MFNQLKNLGKVKLFLSVPWRHMVDWWY